MEEERDRDRWNDLIGWLGMITSLLAGSGVLLFAYQCFRWLVDGYWTSYPIGQTLGVTGDGITWVGLQTIVQYGLDQSLALGLVVIPFLMFFGILSVFDKFD
jgi:hypothetical protein